MKVTELVFDPKYPYPLLPEAAQAFGVEALHAIQCDEWLGYKIESTEAMLKKHGKTVQNENHWIGLAPHALQTPYTELRFILSTLNYPNTADFSLVDLGSAYGRLAFVLNTHYPNAQFTGFEAVKERAIEGQRVIELHKLTRAQTLDRKRPLKKFSHCFNPLQNKPQFKSLRAAAGRDT
jgi:hypothetical protein